MVDKPSRASSTGEILPAEAKEAAARASISGALAKVEQAGRGVVVVSDGLRDLRLIVERGLVTLEALGVELRAGQAFPSMARALEGAIFWEGLVVDADTPQSPPRRRDDLAQARLVGDSLPQVRELRVAVAEYEKQRRKVPSLAVVVERVKDAAAKPSTGADAKLRDALTADGRNEVALFDLAQRAGVDEVDAVVGLGELIDRGELKVVRRHDPNTTLAFLVPALEALDDGLCPGLRAERAARIVKDPKQAPRLWRAAGEARFACARPAEAAECFTQAVTLAPDDVAAREGLVRALDAAAKTREARRAAEELGKLYLDAGLSGRARAALTKAAAEAATPPVEEMLIRALAGAGDLAKAVDRAEALAPKIDRDARRRIADRILRAGPKGPTRDRALRLGRFDKEKRLSLGISVVAGVVFLIGAGFFWEGLARRAYAAACVQARERFAKEGPAVGDLFDSVASRFVLTPTGGQARATAQAFRDLAADAVLLHDRGADLVVHPTDDVDQAQQRIAKFRSDARSQTLRLQTDAVAGAFTRRKQALVARVGEIRGFAASGDGLNALDGVRRLLADWPGARGLLKDIVLPLRIESSPAGATVYWDESRVGTTPLEVGLPVLGPEHTLRMTLNEMKPHERRVSLDRLMSSVIRVNMEQDPAYSHRPPPPKQPPKHTTIKIEEKEQPVESAHQGPRGGMFVVIDQSAEQLRAETGTPADIEPSDPFFAFLKPEIPERYRVTLELLTNAHDGKVFFHGVRLRMEDLVLTNKRLPQRTVEVDECERPLAKTLEGTLKIQTLSRTVNLRADSLREKLVDVVRDLIAANERPDGGSR